LGGQKAPEEWTGGNTANFMKKKPRHVRALQKDHGVRSKYQEKEVVEKTVISVCSRRGHL